MPVDADTGKFIKVVALKNSVEHDGRAQADVVVAKVAGSKPELRGQIKALIPEIRAVVHKINAMALAEQKSLLEKLAPGEMATKKPTAKTPPPIAGIASPSSALNNPPKTTATTALAMRTI